MGRAIRRDKMREIKKVIIHCSATTNFKNVPFKTINRWHKKRGFRDRASGIHCGYHWLFQPSGLVEIGRPVTSIGAHCRGHNRNSIGLCVIGNGLTTEEQLNDVLNRCENLIWLYDLSPADFYGHYEFTKRKTCPAFDMNMFRALL